MGDIKRRTFLKGVGGAAASAVASPLLKTLGGAGPKAIAPPVQKAIEERIMELLIAARGNPKARRKAIVQGLKLLNISPLENTLTDENFDPRSMLDADALSIDSEKLANKLSQSKAGWGSVEHPEAATILGATEPVVTVAESELFEEIGQVYKGLNNFPSKLNLDLSEYGRKIKEQHSEESWHNTVADVERGSYGKEFPAGEVYTGYGEDSVRQQWQRWQDQEQLKNISSYPEDMHTLASRLDEALVHQATDDDTASLGSFFEPKIGTDELQQDIDDASNFRQTVDSFGGIEGYTKSFAEGEPKFDSKLDPESARTYANERLNLGDDLFNRVVKGVGISDEDLKKGNILPTNMITNMLPMGKVVKGAKHVGGKLFNLIVPISPTFAVDNCGFVGVILITSFIMIKQELLILSKTHIYYTLKQTIC